jgi:FlaA1/EpsC-like NDP-sugar epimerase
MFKLRANTPRWVIVVMDQFLAFSALILAYLIRFDLEADVSLVQSEWLILSKSLWLFFLVKLVVFYLFKIHKGLVRYTSSVDLRRIFLAVLTTSFLYFSLGLIRFYFLDGYFLFPSSVLIMEFFLVLSFMIGIRFLVKLFYLESIKINQIEERILIYGAGVSGLITKRTIEKDARLSYKIVGFLDDNPKMNDTRLESVPIFHSSKLEKLIKEEGINTVIVAIQNPLEDNKKAIVDTCFELNVHLKKVPSPRSWINGEFSAKQIAKINIEDLLGRKQIVLDEHKISTELTGKTVLVTGAAGSIGAGMVRQLARYSIQQLILLDQAESPMYDLQHAIAEEFPNLNFDVVIGDIRSFERMERMFDYFKPNFVFHAAAYKHVPLMESNPSEAVLTNVKGTRNLVDLSQKYGVEKFVMVSTDKAVNPTNVMGASKRIAEIYAQAAHQTGTTKFITTRFGNVLGSNGSVIPLFQRQIENGGPITVTDERVTRYFMTISEACQLVLEAGIMGEGGEIFVFDMGKSVKIIDLAKKMIRLSGLELGKDVDIKITGLRPGEKLYEELLAEEESTIPTHHPKILRAKMREEDVTQLAEIDLLIQLFETQRNNEIVAKMKQIVPEFISNNSAFEKLDAKKI